MKFRKKPVEVEAVRVKSSRNGTEVDYWRLNDADGRIWHLSDWEFRREYEPVEPADCDVAVEHSISKCPGTCDHGSPCTLPADHQPPDCHETEHGCICYDPQPVAAPCGWCGVVDATHRPHPGCIHEGPLCASCRQLEVDAVRERAADSPGTARVKS